MLREEKESYVIVSVLDLVFPLTVAEMIALTLDVTAMVEIVKVAELCPAGMVIVVGSVAVVLLDERVTVHPPAGAGPVNKIVPVELAPPTTVLGDSESALKFGAAMIRL